MNDMRQPEHEMLWNGLLTRSYDEFWSINRRLMTVTTGGSGYRHLPVRVYSQDGTYRQVLVAADEGSDSPVSVRDLLRLCSIDWQEDAMTLVCQGVKLQPEDGLYELTQTLAYPDNFLYICVLRESPGHMTEEETSSTPS